MLEGERRNWFVSPEFEFWDDVLELRDVDYERGEKSGRIRNGEIGLCHRNSKNGLEDRARF